MKGRYSHPLAFKAALEQRLRDDALRSATDLQRLRQLVVFDRFLARVFHVFESAVLKGALALELRAARARSTKDVDLRLAGGPVQILSRLQEAGRLDLDDYLGFEVREDKRKPLIVAEALPYDGVRLRAEARLAGKVYGRPFGVDVAIAEPLVGTPEPLVWSPFLAFAGIEPTQIMVYPLETHIAEKLHAYTLPRPSPNSRVKDLPDIALLGSIRPLEALTVRSAFEETFANRSTHPVPPTVPDPPKGWGPVYERMARSEGLPWSTLEELLRRVRQFLDPALGAETGRWDPSSWGWRRAPR